MLNINADGKRRERRSGGVEWGVFSVFLRPLCCTLNVQIIEDFCEKNKDKFRVSASLLILFTPSLVGPVIQQHPAVGAHYISAM